MDSSAIAFEIAARAAFKDFPRAGAFRARFGSRRFGREGPVTQHEIPGSFWVTFRDQTGFFPIQISLLFFSTLVFSAARFVGLERPIWPNVRALEAQD